MRPSAHLRGCRRLRRPASASSPCPSLHPRIRCAELGLHADFGWTILHLSPLIILVAAPVARAGRTRILQAAALAVTVWIVPILAVLRADAPVAAAFHPVGALLAFWLAIVVARGATSPT